MSAVITPKFFNGAKIVLIDDDIDSLDVAKIVLEFAGSQVTIASNGAEGIKKIREVKPSLIISDISMPIMDGWELIRQLRGDKHLNYLPAIALTAHAMVGDHQKVIDAGFDGYLTKPIDPVNFLSQVSSILKTYLDKTGVKPPAEKDGQIG